MDLALIMTSRQCDLMAPTWTICRWPSASRPLDSACARWLVNFNTGSSLVGHRPVMCFRSLRVARSERLAWFKGSERSQRHFR